EDALVAQQYAAQNIGDAKLFSKGNDFELLSSSSLSYFNRLAIIDGRVVRASATKPIEDAITSASDLPNSALAEPTIADVIYQLQKRLSEYKFTADKQFCDEVRTTDDRIQNGAVVVATCKNGLAGSWWRILTRSGFPFLAVQPPEP